MNLAHILKPNGEFLVVDGDVYSKRVLELESEGMTTSDAQGVTDVEFLQQYKLNQIK